MQHPQPCARLLVLIILLSFLPIPSLSGHLLSILPLIAIWNSGIWVAGIAVCYLGHLSIRFELLSMACPFG